MTIKELPTDNVYANKTINRDADTSSIDTPESKTSMFSTNKIKIYLESEHRNAQKCKYENHDAIRMQNVEH